MIKLQTETLSTMQNFPDNMQNILTELYSFHRFGIKPGLENITILCELLDNPQNKFRTIHIAGTNGKGTTASMIGSILMEAGIKVGLYTSPHILRFNERIRVNGKEISDEEIAKLAEMILPKIREIKGTFFEATTAMAMAHFANSGVEIAVIETGMGGRLDSTNIINPILSVITSIDFDHTAYLGETLESIAEEKAGIMKEDVPAMIAEARSQLRMGFFEKAVEVAAPICFLDDAFSVNVVEYSPEFTMKIDIKTPFRTLQNIECPIVGKHQARNILTAVASLELVRKKLTIPENAIVVGIKNCPQNSGLFGRISKIEIPERNQPFVIDVAHNPSGLRSLIETLRLCGNDSTKWQVIFGAMKDKNVEEMLRELLPITDNLVIPKLNEERAMSPNDLFVLSQKIGFNKVLEFSSVSSGMEEVIAKNVPILVVGSFYLAEEAYQYLNKVIN